VVVWSYGSWINNYYLSFLSCIYVFSTLKGPLLSCGRMVVRLTTIIYHSSLVYMFSQHLKGPLWLRFYGSWNYNYLCNPIQDYISKLSVKIVCRYQRCIIRIRKSETDRQYNGQKKKQLGGGLRSLREGRWFSLGTPVSTTYTTYLHDITELLLNVMSNTIILVLIQDQTTLYMIAKNGLKHSE
jgi:hypothetical protein